MLITVSACERASEPDTSGDIELGVQTDDIQNIDAQQSDDGSLNSADDTDEKTETNPAENDSTEKNNSENDNTENDTESEETVDGSNDDEDKIVSSKNSLYIDYSSEEMESRADVIMICRYNGRTVYVEPDDTAPATYANDVFTDYYVTPLKIVKGSVTAESVPIRIVGGESGEIIYTSNEIVLENGKSYFIFLKEGVPVRSDDVDHYKMLSGGTEDCIPILEDGTLDMTNVDANDADEIAQLYDSVK